MKCRNTDFSSTASIGVVDKDKVTRKTVCKLQSNTRVLEMEADKHTRKQFRSLLRVFPEMSLLKEKRLIGTAKGATSTA